MSADLLREAAESMRNEYETDPYRRGQTMRAVADLLAYQADQHDDFVSNGVMKDHDVCGGDLPAKAVALAHLGRDA